MKSIKVLALLTTCLALASASFAGSCGEGKKKCGAGKDKSKKEAPKDASKS